MLEQVRLVQYSSLLAGVYTSIQNMVQETRRKLTPFHLVVVLRISCIKNSFHKLADPHKKFHLTNKNVMVACVHFCCDWVSFITTLYRAQPHGFITSINNNYCLYIYIYIFIYLYLFLCYLSYNNNWEHLVDFL